MEFKNCEAMEHFNVTFIERQGRVMICRDLVSDHIIVFFKLLQMANDTYVISTFTRDLEHNFVCLTGMPKLTTWNQMPNLTGKQVKLH